MKKFCKRGLCLVLTLVLFAGLLSGLTVSAGAAELTERQQAIMAVAWAYYDKGHSLQYDGKSINDYINRSDYGKTRSSYRASPEDSTPNETTYTVCSDYACQIYWEAFRYEMLGNQGKTWTGTLSKLPKEDPTVVWYYNKDEGKDIKEEIKTMFALAQPGDIVTVFKKTGGHTMIWAGDLTGDGVADLIHSGGLPMDRDKKVDTREYKSKDDPDVDPRIGASFGADTNGGTVRITSDAVAYLTKNYTGAKHRRLTLVRPTNVMTDENYPITPATKYRMSHPRLVINRTLNKTRFNSAFPGETVTMTLELTNKSTQDYTVPVTEKVPNGAKIKTPFTGANVAGDTMTFDVELKAGETKTFTAEFEITAKLGDKVVFEGGSVGDIPSNSIPIQVGGAKLTADETAKLAKIAAGDYNAALKEAKADNNTLADVVYGKILGLNVRLPEYKTIVRRFLKPVKTPSERKTTVFLKTEEVKAEDLTDYRMIVPTWWGGHAIWNRFPNERCSDPRDKYLEPGDVFVRALEITDIAGAEQLIYLGNGKYLSYDKAKGTYPIVEEPEIFRSMWHHIFYVLRPTLTYEDVHKLPALTAAGTLPFTDVKTSDWYYMYVKDLVDDGTVNGMTATTFAPNGTLTYGQALKLIALAVGEKEPAKSGSHWASGYMTLAKSKGWIDKDVDLDATITRLALCRIAAKAANLTEQPSKNPFKDTEDKDVLALNGARIINGMTETEFKPSDKLTRAQISKIICALRAVRSGICAEVRWAAAHE